MPHRSAVRLEYPCAAEPPAVAAAEPAIAAAVSRPDRFGLRCLFISICIHCCLTYRRIPAVLRLTYPCAAEPAAIAAAVSRPDRFGLRRRRSCFPSQLSPAVTVVVGCWSNGYSHTASQKITDDHSLRQDRTTSDCSPQMWATHEKKSLQLIH